MAPSTTDSARKHKTPREKRSVSPSKAATESPAGRVKATPKSRKPKKKEREGAAAATAALANVVADSADSTPVTDAVADAAADAAAEAVAAEVVAEALAEAVAEDVVTEPLAPGTARITVSSDAATADADVSHTSVRVELAADGGEILPETAEEALESARKIVADAKEMQELAAATASAPGSPSAASPGRKSSAKSASRKRKASDSAATAAAVAGVELKEPEEEVIIEEVHEGVNGVAASSSPKHESHPRKRTRVMVPADDFRRQKMQKRALMGLSATLAVGAVIPLVSSLF